MSGDTQITLTGQVDGRAGIQARGRRPVGAGRP